MSRKHYGPHEEELLSKRVLQRRPSSMARVTSYLNQVTDEITENREAQNFLLEQSPLKRPHTSNLTQSRGKTISSSAPSLNQNRNITTSGGGSPTKYQYGSKESDNFPTLFERQRSKRREERNNKPPFVAGSTSKLRRSRPSTSSTTYKEHGRQTLTQESPSEEIGNAIQSCIPAWLQDHDIFNKVDADIELYRRDNSSSPRTHSSGRLSSADRATSGRKLTFFQRTRSGSGSSASQSMYRKNVMEKPYGAGSLKRAASFVRTRSKGGNEFSKGADDAPEKKSEVYQIAAAHEHRLTFLEKSIRYEQSENKLQELLVLRARTYGLHDGRTEEAKRLLMSCYLAQNNISDATELQHNFLHHFGILEFKILNMKVIGTMDTSRSHMSTEAAKLESKPEKRDIHYRLEVSDVDRDQAASMLTRAKRFYRKGHFLPAAYVLSKASLLDHENKEIESLKDSCMRMLSTRVFAEELDISVKLKAKCINDSIIIGEPLKVKYSYTHANVGSLEEEHHPLDWIGITQVLGRSKKQKLREKLAVKGDSFPAHHRSGIKETVSKQSSNRPKHRQIHYNEGTIDFGELTVKAIQDSDLEADAKSITAEDIVERLSIPYEYDERLVDWCYVPRDGNCGTVTFTSQPAESGIYRIRYFIQGTTLSVGSPVTVYAKHVDGNVKAPFHHVCGDPLYVDYSLKYNARKCIHGAWISLWAHGSKLKLWKKAAAAVRLGAFHDSRNKGVGEEEEIDNTESREDNTGVLGIRSFARRSPYEPSKPIESIPVGEHHEGRVCFPTHPLYPGVYEIRLYTGNRLLVESQIDELGQGKDKLQLDTENGKVSTNVLGVCIAVSNRIVVTGSCPKYLLHPYTHLRRDHRIYVSGACGDSVVEREALFTTVAPRFREICERRAVNATFVDLRQGLPETEEVLRGDNIGRLSSEQGREKTRRSSTLSLPQDASSTSHMTCRGFANSRTSKWINALDDDLQIEQYKWRVELALREINECRPNAICILGKGYGWELPRPSAQMLFGFPWMKISYNKEVAFYYQNQSLTPEPEESAESCQDNQPKDACISTVFRQNLPNVSSPMDLPKSFLHGYSRMREDSSVRKKEKKLLPKTQLHTFSNAGCCSWLEAELTYIYKIPQYNPELRSSGLEALVRMLLAYWLTLCTEGSVSTDVDESIEGAINCGVNSVASTKLLSLAKASNHYVVNTAAQWVAGKLESPPISNLTARKLRDVEPPFSTSVAAILADKLSLSTRLKLFCLFDRQKLLAEPSKVLHDVRERNDYDIADMVELVAHSEHLVEDQVYNSILYTRHPSMALKGVTQTPWLSLTQSLPEDVSSKAFTDFRNSLMNDTPQSRVGYTTITNFAEWVLADCINSFNNVFPPSDTPESGELLGLGVSAFSSYRRSLVAIHERLIQCMKYLEKYVRNENHGARARLPQLVVGPSGGGKSTLLLNWLASLEPMQRDSEVSGGPAEDNANVWWKRSMFHGDNVSGSEEQIFYDSKMREGGMWQRGANMVDVSVDRSPFMKLFQECSPVPHVAVYKNNDEWWFTLYGCIGVAGFPKTGIEIVTYVSQEVCIAATQIAFKKDSIEEEEVRFMTEVDDLFEVDPWYVVTQLETQYNMLADSVARGRSYNFIGRIFSELLGTAGRLMKVVLVLDGADLIVDNPPEWSMSTCLPSRRAIARNRQTKASYTLFDYREFEQNDDVTASHLHYDQVRNCGDLDEKFNIYPTKYWFVPNSLPANVYFIISMKSDTEVWNSLSSSSWGYAAVHVPPPTQRAISEVLALILRSSHKVRCPEWSGSMDLKFQHLLNFPSPPLHSLVNEEAFNRDRGHSDESESTSKQKPKVDIDKLRIIDAAEMITLCTPVPAVNYSRAQRHPILECSEPTAKSLLDPYNVKTSGFPKVRNVVLDIVTNVTREAGDNGEKLPRDVSLKTKNEEDTVSESEWAVQRMFNRFSEDEKSVTTPEYGESLREALIRILTARIPEETRCLERTRQREAALRNPGLIRTFIAALSMTVPTECYIEAVSLAFRLRADPRLEVATAMVFEGLERKYPIGLDIICLLRCCRVGLSENELIDLLGGHAIKKESFPGHERKSHVSEMLELEKMQDFQSQQNQEQNQKKGVKSKSDTTKSVHFSDVVEQVQKALGLSASKEKSSGGSEKEVLTPPPKVWAHYDAAAWSASRKALLGSVVNVCRGLWCLDGPEVERMIDQWLLPSWKQREVYLQRIIAYFWVRPVCHRKLEELPHALLQLLSWSDYKIKNSETPRRSSLASGVGDSRRASVGSATTKDQAQAASNSQSLKEQVSYNDVTLAGAGGVLFQFHDPEPLDEHDPNFLVLLKKGVTYSGVTPVSARSRSDELVEIKARHKSPWEAMKERDPYELLRSGHRPDRVFAPSAARISSQLLTFLACPSIFGLAMSSQVYRMDYIRAISFSGFSLPVIVDTFRSAWEFNYDIEGIAQRPNYHRIRHSDYHPSSELNTIIEQQESQAFVFARHWHLIRTSGTENLMKLAEVFLDLGDFGASQQSLECAFLIMTKGKSMDDGLSEYTDDMNHKMDELERTKTITRRSGEPLVKGHTSWSFPPPKRSAVERHVQKGTSNISLHEYKTPKQLLSGLVSETSGIGENSGTSNMRRSQQFVDVENICQVCGMLGALMSFSEMREGSYLEQGGLQAGDPSNPVYSERQKCGAAHEVRPTEIKARARNLVKFITAFERIVGDGHYMLNFGKKEARTAVAMNEASYQSA